MTQRGLPDNARSSRYVLKDFVNGKLLFCHAPPGVNQEDYHQFPDVLKKIKKASVTQTDDIPVDVSMHLTIHILFMQL